jgi:hypothetical protein
MAVPNPPKPVLPSPHREFHKASQPNQFPLTASTMPLQLHKPKTITHLLTNSIQPANQQSWQYHFTKTEPKANPCSSITSPHQNSPQSKPPFTTELHPPITCKSSNELLWAFTKPS